MDLVPNDVTGAERLSSVLTFMKEIGEALQKPVVLTPENERDKPLLRFIPGDESVDYVADA